MTNYYVGIDGGGTKTKVIIIDDNQNIVFERTSGPSSVDTVSEETTFQSFFEPISEFSKLNEFSHFTSFFAGIGGIVFKEDEEKVIEIIKKLPKVSNQTLIDSKNDMENALYSSGEFNHGIALICGTGMVAFGKNDHQSHKCGGWGYKEGELGSGYHLGSEAIRYSIRAFDGRYVIDDFAKEVASSIHMEKATDIISIMNHLYGDRTAIASLARIVVKHANLGNIHAMKIVDIATDELALAIHGVYSKLKFDKTSLVIIGGLGNADGYFKNQLHKKIHSSCPLIEIIPMKYDPAHAAALMAYHLAH